MKHFHIYQFIKEHILSSWFEHDNCDWELKKFIIKIDFSIDQSDIKDENDESNIEHFRKSNHESDKSLDAAKIQLCDFTSRTQSIWTKTKTSRTS